ncbi:MAG TPA: glycosyltransferase family 4 protein [Candidatus Levybacteria bacterium]|nr:glycosyltransferase family 4 protein [Candidatus Levybacteria bacterium]
MKLLILTYDFPYPTTSGGKSRIYNLIKFLKKKNIEIYLLSFVRDTYKKKYNDPILEIGVSEIIHFKRKKVRSFPVMIKASLSSGSVFKTLYSDQKVEKKIIDMIREKNIDTILFESFYTSFYISEKIKKMKVRQIFGTENIEHMLYHDFAANKSKIVKNVYMSQVAKIKNEEEEAYNKSDLIVAVTEEEKNYIHKKTKTHIEIIPNGVDSSSLSFKSHFSYGKKLLFVGNFSYFPNVDAMDFFYKNVFLNIPDASLTVVGKYQNKLPFLVSDSRVLNIEYVEDIASVYYDSDIFVFPVRFGGGTNFKVLEAASCGTPIIAIPSRVKGLGFVPDTHFIEATSPVDFMRGIRRLSEEKELQMRITKNARILIEDEYDWKKIGEKFGRILQVV